MTLIRWSPRQFGLEGENLFRDVGVLYDEIDKTFQRLFPKNGGTQIGRLKSWGNGSWVPSVDLIDKKTELVLKAELPGVDKKDIQLSFDDGLLTLKAERKAEEEIKENDYYYNESAYGKFYRSMSLPEAVDSARVNAIFKNGILEIHLPKSKVVKQEAKQIVIQ